MDDIPEGIDVHEVRYSFKISIIGKYDRRRVVEALTPEHFSLLALRLKDSVYPSDQDRKNFGGPYACLSLDPRRYGVSISIFKGLTVELRSSSRVAITRVAIPLQKALRRALPRCIYPLEPRPLCVVETGPLQLSSLNVHGVLPENDPYLTYKELLRQYYHYFHMNEEKIVPGVSQIKMNYHVPGTDYHPGLTLGSTSLGVIGHLDFHYLREIYQKIWDIAKTCPRRGAVRGDGKGAEAGPGEGMGRSTG